MSDLISRQAAIDALNDEFTIIGKTNAIVVQDYIRRVNNRLHDLPSAEPERKKGKWIYNSPVTMKCDQCGLVIKDWDWNRFKYCPNCGADMRGEENET